MTPSPRFAPLVGRILMALIFLLSGFNKITGWHQTAQFMAAKGMPLVPLFLAGAIVVELGGGLSVLLGFKTRIGATVLFLFLIPTTLIFHNFWALQGMEKTINMIMFMKNLAIMGGLAVLAAYGAGPYSLDKPANEA